jgi:hypothetical protein
MLRTWTRPAAQGYMAQRTCAAVTDLCLLDVEPGRTAHIMCTDNRYNLGSGLKFMWKDGSGQFWKDLIIYNVPNGVKRVEQQTSSGWRECAQLSQLRQHAILADPAGNGTSYNVRVCSCLCSGWCSGDGQNARVQLCCGLPAVQGDLQSLPQALRSHAHLQVMQKNSSAASVLMLTMRLL